MSDKQPAHPRRLWGRSMRFWGLLAAAPGTLMAIGFGQVLFDLVPDVDVNGPASEPTFKMIAAVGLLVSVGLALPGWILFWRHIHDPSSLQLWLAEVASDPGIQHELYELDAAFQRGELTGIGYEVARSELRFQSRA